MTSTNDIRRAFLDYFGGEGHQIVPLGAAGAAERSDPDVRQRRHGAVQERLHRPRDPALFDRGLARRNASAPAASITISTMSATPRATTPSSRCSAISRSATISRSGRSTLAWTLLTREWGLVAGPADRHRLSYRRRGLRPVEEDRRPAREPDHPHPDQGQFLGDGRQRPVRALLGDLLRPWRPHPRRPARQRRTRTATASSRSGTSSSCNTSRRTMRSSATCRKPVDRHRHGAGADRRRAAGRPRQLRHRHLQGADRRLDRADPDQGRRRHARPATGSSPIICAPRAS